MSTRYTFFWSPEGRPLLEVTANDYKTAKAAFKREFPQYAKYMGEVYVEKDLAEEQVSRMTRRITA